MYTLAKTDKIERNCATLVRKSAQILNANLRYRRSVFFAYNLPRFCLIYVSFFELMVTSLHFALNIPNYCTECIYNPQLGLI